MGWGLREESAPEKGTQAVVTIPLCSDRAAEYASELRNDTELQKANQQYQLRAMLVRELRTMPERGSTDEL